MFRKVKTILLCMTLVSGLAACSASTSGDSLKNVGQTEEPAKTTDAEGETTQGERKADTKKTAVVYFSATGNTERVAKVIAEATGGELLKLEPVQPYTAEDLNYNDPNSRVSSEHDDESLREVPLTVSNLDDWQSVGTVYIGYPIWWGIAAWPVDSFIKANDFTGKTVIPFCTSASSSIGNSDKLLAELAGSGEWLDGKRFGSNASEKEIQDWADSFYTE